jgi:type II secretion system protein G
MMVKRTRKGITLIELLIVVLILGALSAIAIPRISQSANNAKQKACDVNVDIINSAIEMYNADTGAYPVLSGDLTDVTINTTYFPDGEPACPYSTPYVMNATTKRVASHVH